MIKHLYNLNKPCPGIKSTVELTDEIKKHILDNRIYVPVQVNKNNSKREKITSATKIACWNAHIGEDIGSTMCLCCKSVKITQHNFVCGHVIADVHGGTLAIDNIRPICAKCNSSMATMNMDDFISQHKF